MAAAKGYCYSDNIDFELKSITKREKKDFENVEIIKMKTKRQE